MSFHAQCSKLQCQEASAVPLQQILRRAEKDRSALQEVAGIAPSVLARSGKHPMAEAEAEAEAKAEAFKTVGFANSLRLP